MTITARELQQRLGQEMALPSRLRYSTLLITTVSALALVLPLWLSEPQLPARTHVAFAGLIAVNLTWAVFAAWMLRTRKVLYARDRVLAARIAVGVTSLATIGALLLWERLGPSASATGTTLILVSVSLLVRANRTSRALQRRRLELERELGRS